MKTGQQMLPLDPDVDELIERIVRDTGRTKRHVGNDLIRTECRRRKLVREEEDGKVN